MEDQREIKVELDQIRPILGLSFRHLESKNVKERRREKGREEEEEKD